MHCVSEQREEAALAWPLPLRRHAISRGRGGRPWGGRWEVREREGDGRVTEEVKRQRGRNKRSENKGRSFFENYLRSWRGGLYTPDTAWHFSPPSPSQSSRQCPQQTEVSTTTLPDTFHRPAPRNSSSPCSGYGPRVDISRTCSELGAHQREEGKWKWQSQK
jgi:hypothetical protein